MVTITNRNTFANAEGRAWTLLRNPKRDGAVYRAPAIYTGPEIAQSKYVTLTLDAELYVRWLKASLSGAQLGRTLEG